MTQQGDRPYFKGTEVFKVGAILYLMMTRQTIPDPEECTAEIVTPREGGKNLRLECGVYHWYKTSNTPGCPVWPMGRFNLTTKLKALVQGFDHMQPTVGYTPELVDLVSQLLGSYRQTVNTAQLWGLAKGRYEEWKEETKEGQRHVDHWDDLVQRETNRRKKQEAESATAIRQSGPRAKEYTQQPVGGIRAKAKTVPQRGL